MNALKRVTNTYQLRLQEQFPGLTGINILASEYPIEPFLVFTEYYMDRPVFGPHPHAGISVMTYMLPDSKESFINRDSNGDFSIIEPGGLHITQAGSGIHHDEFPKNPGNMTHGFQIWINHSFENRMVTPKAMHAVAADIPEVITEDYKVRVLHGSFAKKIPGYKMVTDITLLHIYLQPGKSITLDADEMAFIYALNGSGTTQDRIIGEKVLIIYDTTGNKIAVQALESGLEFMFSTGTPQKEEIIYGGPFVMTTREQMFETKKRYSMGQMGNLLPYQQ
jgi:redox-sensitive bicupin YhaK (pirin superfamily)